MDAIVQLWWLFIMFMRTSVLIICLRACIRKQNVKRVNPLCVCVCDGCNGWDCIIVCVPVRAFTYLNYKWLIFHSFFFLQMWPQNVWLIFFKWYLTSSVFEPLRRDFLYKSKDPSFSSRKSSRARGWRAPGFVQAPGFCVGFTCLTHPFAPHASQSWWHEKCWRYARL